MMCYRIGFSAITLTSTQKKKEFNENISFKGYGNVIFKKGIESYFRYLLGPTTERVNCEVKLQRRKACHVLIRNRAPKKWILN